MWNDPNNTGKLTGKAAVLNSFYGDVATVSATYIKKSFGANEEQSFLLEIPLDELGKQRPETLYFRLDAYINGKLSSVQIHFTIEW